MLKKERINMIEILGNYGHYICKVGAAMYKAGISVTKMRKLTGINHEIVKKYYEDSIVRIDKDVLARIAFVLKDYGIDPNDLFEYIPSNEKDEMKDNPTKSHRED